MQKQELCFGRGKVSVGPNAKAAEKTLIDDWVKQAPVGFVQEIGVMRSCGDKGFLFRRRDKYGEGGYSSGIIQFIRNLLRYKQRVGIAQALLGNPKVIILDEPTVGLDPLQIIEIRDLIRGLGQKHTVILSSHILSEVQAICDQILIINKGRLIAFDNPENLEKKMMAPSEIYLTTDALKEEVPAILKEIPHIEQVMYQGEDNGRTSWLIKSSAPDIYDLSGLLFHLFGQNGKTLYEIRLRKVNLEDIFLELTEEKTPEPTQEVFESGDEDHMAVYDMENPGADPEQDAVSPSFEYGAGSENPADSDNSSVSEILDDADKVQSGEDLK